MSSLNNRPAAIACATSPSIPACCSRQEGRHCCASPTVRSKRSKHLQVVKPLDLGGVVLEGEGLRGSKQQAADQQLGGKQGGRTPAQLSAAAARMHGRLHGQGATMHTPSVCAADNYRKSRQQSITKAVHLPCLVVVG